MAMLRAFFAGNIGLDGGAKGKLNGETERDSKLCPFPQKSDLPATSVGTVRRRWENILHAAVGGAPRGRIRKIRARGDALRNKSRGGGGRPREQGCRWKERSDGNRMAGVRGSFRGGDGNYGAETVIFGRYDCWRKSSLWGVGEVGKITRGVGRG